jgi:hypothetical protein
MRYLVAIVLACLLSLPAHAADKAIDALDKLTGEFALYVSVPEVTPELADALVRAHGRGVHMDVMIPSAAAGSREVHRLGDAGVRVVIFERITEAVILYDDALMAEGPDARHMVVRRDRKASDDFALGFIAQLISLVEKQERT